MTRDTLKLTLKNDLSELKVLQNALEDFAERTGLASGHLLQINLVLEELFANVVASGYGDQKTHWITVRLDWTPAIVVIRFEDDGAPFDPLKTPPPDLDCPAETRRIGGLGIHLIKKMTDDIHYRREGDKNVLILKKFISEAPNPPASENC